MHPRVLADFDPPLPFVNADDIARNLSRVTLPKRRWRLAGLRFAV